MASLVTFAVASRHGPQPHLRLMASSASPDGPVGVLRASVASTNPVKVNSVHKALAECFPGRRIEVHGCNVASGVPDQPMSDQETKQGAMNRARGAQAAGGGFDFFVGVEGGLEVDTDGKMQCFAWMVVLGGGVHSGRMGLARTATFELPEKVSALVRGGMELGHADDVVFKDKNSKQKGGTVGKLTDGLVDRTEYYRHAMLMALIPFLDVNSGLY